MFRAVTLISIGSFTMAVIALYALEIPGGYLEMAVVATLITAGITGVVCLAARFPTKATKPKLQGRIRRALRLRRLLGVDRHGAGADLSRNAVRHR